MIESVDQWLTAHSLWHDAIILVLTIVLTPLISRTLSTFKKFISIPPQRLNVWILKARISSADAQLAHLYCLRQDQSYLIVKCFQCMVLMVGGSTLYIVCFLINLSGFQALTADLVIHQITHNGEPGFLVIWFQHILLIGLLITAVSSTNIVSAIIHGDKRERLIKETIERLKLKLKANRYYKADSDA
jgi:hypothetical protein